MEYMKKNVNINTVIRLKVNKNHMENATKNNSKILEKKKIPLKYYIYIYMIHLVIDVTMINRVQ